MTLAKGLGFGLPIGAFLSKEYCMALVPGDHGSTFGGNALTTAVAFAGTDHLLSSGVLQNVKDMEIYFMNALNQLKEKYGFINEVRGKGLLIAMEFDQDISAQMLTDCNAAGLLLNAPRPNAIRFMPPLNITSADVDECVEKLDSVLSKI
jgi:acetylornithine/succinyldiaminopimelate/putrescine aminotransferase